MSLLLILFGTIQMGTWRWKATEIKTPEKKPQHNLVTNQKPHKTKCVLKHAGQCCLANVTVVLLCTYVKYISAYVLL